MAHPCRSAIGGFIAGTGPSLYSRFPPMADDHGGQESADAVEKLGRCLDAGGVIHFPC
jgi:hypothetical protein